VLARGRPGNQVRTPYRHAHASSLRRSRVIGYDPLLRKIDRSRGWKEHHKLYGLTGAKAPKR
jgi:hypothetical protein